jgi:hypothetical protein
MRVLATWTLALGFGFLLAGCMSTPARRIEQNAALFATFPPEAQAKVRNGEIAIGFTKDMVRLAIGGPRQIHTRTTREGDAEVWTYTSFRYTTSLEPVDDSYYYRDRSGRLRQASGAGWMNVQHRTEYPYLRVEFEGNSVKAIEKLK